MYVPEPFRELREEVLHRVIAQHPLALLVTSGPEGPVATAIPMVLHEQAGAAVLRGHLARANPHWRAIGSGALSLAIFQGARHYITPSWYATKAQTGKVVPTWNYEMVEVRGTVRVIDDAGWLRAQIGTITDRQEAARAEPWSADDMPADFGAAMLRGIVGVELAVDGMTGAIKAGQNRNEVDRHSLAAGLTAAGGPDAAALVRHLMPPPAPEADAT